MSAECKRCLGFARGGAFAVRPSNQRSETALTRAVEKSENEKVPII